MQAVLVMFRSDGERRSFSLSREMTVVGRRQDCDLMIPLGEISRKHCRFIKEGDTLRLEDLGSSNGTFVNGRRVQEVILSPGDTVQVGPVTFVIQVDGVPADDDVQPFATGGAPVSAGVADDEETLEAIPQEDDDDLLEAKIEEDDDLSELQARGKGTPADDELEVLSDDSPGDADQHLDADDTDSPKLDSDRLTLDDDESTKPNRH